jgi:hypothetical protein
MPNFQFTIRSLLAVTLLVALSLPIAIAHYDDVVAYFNPPPKPSAADIIPALIRRVNPSSAKEIMIRPLNDSQIEVTIPD